MDAYARAGVDYATLDAGKRDALTHALATSALLPGTIDASRGEPAFAFRFAGRTLAVVLEGLGTKAVIARHVGRGFDAVAYDTVAAIVNDLVCIGALPLVVNAYFATGAAEWYAAEERHALLLDGWRRGCEDAGAAWGGGESPTLPGLVAAEDIELAGCAVGALPDGVEPLLGDDLTPGDEIVLVASSGLHANGASLARRVAGELPDGYATPLPSGRTFGDALLDPSVIYAGLVRELLADGVSVHYLSHITGHGLLKLMRPRRALGYRLTRLPEVPEVLGFLSQRSGLDAEAAYSTLNMGAGFAVYCAAGQAGRVLAHAAALGLPALLAGEVTDGPRRVILEPVGVTYAGERLDLGPST